MLNLRFSTLALVPEVLGAVACSSTHAAVGGGGVVVPEPAPTAPTAPIVPIANTAPSSPPITPCPPAGTPCKILPLGDSITNGTGASGGYRVELFRQSLANGKSVTFVGSLRNGPDVVDDVPFPRNHEGHNGWTIAEVSKLVPAPALSEAPHVILLHVGTNDMYKTPQGAAERLGTLIDAIVASAPDAVLAVAKIIPASTSWGAEVFAYDAQVPAVVQARAASGKRVILVDQFSGFPEDELGDGTHPNEDGYARMGRVWYAAIGPYLN